MYRFVRAGIENAWCTTLLPALVAENLSLVYQQCVDLKKCMCSDSYATHEIVATFRGPGWHGNITFSTLQQQGSVWEGHSSIDLSTISQRGKKHTQVLFMFLVWHATCINTQKQQLYGTAVQPLRKGWRHATGTTFRRAFGASIRPEYDVYSHMDNVPCLHVWCRGHQEKRMYATLKHCTCRYAEFYAHIAC